MAEQKIDLGLYSRQLYVLGLETLVSLGKANVLISGLRGLGAEIAKNVILAGVKSVTVHDRDNVEKRDMAAQFYLGEEDIGKNRAESCVTKLAELNQYVEVKASKEELTKEYIGQFQVVVLTELPVEEKLRELAKFCHNHSPAIHLIIAQVRGLTAQIFVDHGPQFTVTDPNGEEYPQQIIVGISASNPAIVTLHEDHRISFETDDEVVLDDLKGLDCLNGKQFPVKVTGPYNFELVGLDATSLPAYKSGGLVQQVKKPVILANKEYEQAIKAPGEFEITDFAKMERPGQLHLGYIALEAYRSANNGAYPELGNVEQANAVVNIAKQINEQALKIKQEDSSAVVFSVDSIDESVILKLALYSRSQINPMTAFVGGIAGQEVLKLSGKFKPINQFFYFDAFECLAGEGVVERRRAAGESRYEDQIGIFGEEFQEKLGKLKIFLVGAGALGCEFLKNFAMMGVSTREEGMCHLTDMDSIEKSNLNRQFLFRPRDIGSMKSQAASRAVRVMNSDFRVKAMEIPVGPTTEETFHEAFWGNLDIVCNALDNVKARLYVDSCCVLYKKPLLESGTLGTKANVQVVIPNVTESYGSSADPPEKEVPSCTIKNFPNQIEHTIQWARDLFEGFFTNGFRNAIQFCNDSDFVSKLRTSNTHMAVQRETLQTIFDSFSFLSNPTFDNCINWARLRFEDLYSNKIKQLLFNFPADHADSTGAPFWSGPKRAPSPLSFSINDPTHLGFVICSSRLLANCFKINHSSFSDDYIAHFTANINVPTFQPRSGIKIQSSEKDNVNEGGDDDEEVIESLLKRLPKREEIGAQGKFSAEEFEKDDDTNFHIDFVTHASNLRASNYEIKLADRNQTKKIAGRIIPAIATTTAMVTGLVCLELIKLIHQNKPIEHFKNGFVNLALPLWAFSEPLPPTKTCSKAGKTRAVPESWTLWDSVIIDQGDITFNQLLQFFRDRFQLEVLSVASGQSLIYNSFIPKYKARIELKISDVLREINKSEFGPNVKHINMAIECEDPSDENLEVNIPLVRVKFRN
eukprot:TRINITY_DN3391_c1_g2_i1.p1 TRINITY_DN3391_c1_g2~~TRINITY_DN3391_c1_g2_i1.p1  ORF type:complete len:1034 (-),score=479.85 TRINITY_DN3391_c1_g2_i1:116-3217(-)